MQGEPPRDEEARAVLGLLLTGLRKGMAAVPGQ